MVLSHIITCGSKLKSYVKCACFNKWVSIKRKNTPTMYHMTYWPRKICWTITGLLREWSNLFRRCNFIFSLVGEIHQQITNKQGHWAQFLLDSIETLALLPGICFQEGTFKVRTHRHLYRFQFQRYPYTESVVFIILRRLNTQIEPNFP